MEKESVDENNTRRLRQEDRRTKRKLRKLKKEKAKADEVRAPKSQKVTLISNETFRKIQESDSSRAIVFKNKHFKAAIALTDFIVERKNNTKKRTFNRIPGTTIKDLNQKKGKVREIPKRKCLSRLKRAILEIRRSRLKDLESVVDVECPNVGDVSASLHPTSNVREIVVAPTPSPLLTFSRKFRSYCDHENIIPIREFTEKLLGDLFRFQDRAYTKNPIKACAHRRYVVGFKETERSLQINKVKLVIIATDLEPSPGANGLDAAVEKMKSFCQKKSVPYCFPLQRRKIGYLLFKKAPISCVGVLDYSGAEDHFKQIVNHVRRSRNSLEKEMEKLQL